MTKSFEKFEDVFNGLLDTYQEIGQNLPLLQQYRELFNNDSFMVRILSVIYEDILKFHRIAIKYYNQGCELNFHPLESENQTHDI